MATAALSFGATVVPETETAPYCATGIRPLDPESTLVSRCLSGDETAWEELVRQHTRQVYGLCYRFTGSGPEAQDLTQDVFLRVFRTLKSFRSTEGSFGTWLSRLTRNLLIDHYLHAAGTRYRFD
jgi:RNA polymerase sigma-70 factor, ECF subfamily